ncbi:MAG: hypothetical protein H7A36_01880 [Chlamydiales bacterium]|nr:hypothetical protein [Chlamydiales bacterium]
MRVDVHKQLILGPTSQKDRFFEQAQELGVIEFIGPKGVDRSDEIQAFSDALHVLRRMIPVKQAHPQHFYSPNMLARHIIEYNERLEHLYEEKRVIEKEIARIAPFGEFSLSTVRSVEMESGRVFQFFFAKAGTVKDLPTDVLYLSTESEIDYFVSIAKERSRYAGFTEIFIEKSLPDLEYTLAATEKEIDHLEVELGALSHQKKVLRRGLIKALNERHLEEAKEKAAALESGEVFAVESWIPENKMGIVQKLAEELNIYIEPIAEEKKDRPPTYLENKGWSRLGEDLINIYDTPAKTDRDPSLWVFISFAIFFAMIIADVGYGSILLGIGIWLWFKFRKVGGAMTRFIRLTNWLAVGCIIWGVMLTSFFGIEFRPDSKLRKVSLIHWMVNQKAAYFIDKKPEAFKDLLKEYPEAEKAQTSMELLMSVNRPQEGKDNYVIYSNFTNNVLIELSIFIGFLHLLVSFARYADRRWSAFGWILFLIGGYLYFPQVIKATSLIYFVFHVPAVAGAAIGLWVLFVGIGLAGVLAVWQHKWAGLAEPMHVISVFADVMSYLRIYALSLAGMIMATTFDQIGTGMALYFGIFIILAGHLVNITLALMGGVIHGLRLNFIEWYHYSFDGGGRSFLPLFRIKE